MSEAQKRTPRPAPDRRDAKSFPLSPTDGFVLSRIDGMLGEVDLTASIGLPDGQVEASLAKLAAFGLIVFDETADGGAATLRGSPPKKPAISSAAPQTAPQRPMQSPTGAASAPSPAVLPPAGQNHLADDDQASMGEDVDLDVELRKRVLEVYRALDRGNHYSILGIPESADRKAIKRAYYELAAAFHPDRYFRKRLGSFKLKMEAVFARVTLAHDTLSDREKRGEYNAYLGERRISQAIEENLARGLTEAKEARESAERSAHAEAEAMSAAAPSPTAPLAMAASVRPSGASGPHVDEAARRDALARRLLGRGPPRASTSMPRPPMQAADAMDALRRRYEERLSGAKESQAGKMVLLGESALASRDLVGAANAFRSAADLLPDDAALAKRALDARVKADDLLRTTYTKQALYEETHDQWPEAERSWARVCDVSPDDANAHERAGHAALKAGVHLHDAARFAQRACQLDPKNALFRITLASCYGAAGLVLNARRELDTAAQLAPHDDTIQEMIRRVGESA